LVRERKRLLATAPVLHYIGSRKPWNRGLGLRTQSEWLEHARRCGWFANWFAFACVALPVRFDSLSRRALRWVTRTASGIFGGRR
jgi:hypothetical protein